MFCRNANGSERASSRLSDFRFETTLSLSAPLKTFLLKEILHQSRRNANGRLCPRIWLKRCGEGYCALLRKMEALVEANKMEDFQRLPRMRLKNKPVLNFLCAGHLPLSEQFFQNIELPVAIHSGDR